ncbi:hypothetical protein DFH06DRAFT_1224298 [Mycena polygramma]|nr:hypothetical protein DFH06DRAFT_1224298 [Mycena polygramma]
MSSRPCIQRRRNPGVRARRGGVRVRAQPALPLRAVRVRAAARDAGTRPSVRKSSRSRSDAGHSTAFAGVSLDLRRMNATSLDMAAKSIIFNAGCQWATSTRSTSTGTMASRSTAAAAPSSAWAGSSSVAGSGRSRAALGATPII